MRFGALGLKCQIYSTMATTMTGARKSGYVPRKVARVIKKRAMPRKEEREKKAKKKDRERKAKETEKAWQGACVPPDIRRPWDVFQQDVSERWSETLTGEDRSMIRG